MAASAFLIYNEAKKYIGNGTIVLGTAAFKLKLTTSASNASTFTLSTFASVDNEIAATGGYVANGLALQSMVWTVGASAKQYKFDAADLVFTASGASLTNVKFGVIGVSGGKALCWSKLSTSQFTVTSGNTLTIQFNASGIFTLV
jgi:hypothetical protein